jgi:hypothetical protein
VAAERAKEMLAMITRPHHSRTSFAALSLALAMAALVPASALGVEQKVENTPQFSVTAGSLSFPVEPKVPNLPSVTLKGESQTTNAEMAAFSVTDATGSGSGWKVDVEGFAGALKSAVFAQYCPNTTCGSDSKGYVTGGATLPANSLTLSSTGASFTAEKGTTGTAPTFQCSSACNVDSASAVKTISAAEKAGMGTYKATWSNTSLTLTLPSTTKALPAEEVYRVNLQWTLSTGP